LLAHAQHQRVGLLDGDRTARRGRLGHPTARGGGGGERGGVHLLEDRHEALGPLAGLRELRERGEQLLAVGGDDGALVEQAVPDERHREAHDGAVAPAVHLLREVRAELGHVQHLRAEQREDDLAVELALVVRVEHHVRDKARDLVAHGVDARDELHVDLRVQPRGGARRAAARLVHALEDLLHHGQRRLVA